MLAGCPSSVKGQLMKVPRCPVLLLVVATDIISPPCRLHKQHHLAVSNGNILKPRLPLVRDQGCFSSTAFIFSIPWGAQGAALGRRLQQELERVLCRWEMVSFRLSKHSCEPVQLPIIKPRSKKSATNSASFWLRQCSQSYPLSFLGVTTVRYARGILL